jgi:hypothetical protein
VDILWIIPVSAFEIAAYIFINVSLHRHFLGVIKRNEKLLKKYEIKEIHKALRAQNIFTIVICMSILIYNISKIIEFSVDEWNPISDYLFYFSSFITLLLTFLLFKSLIACAKVADDSEKLRNTIRTSRVMHESTIKHWKKTSTE